MLLRWCSTVWGDRAATRGNRRGRGGPEPADGPRASPVRVMTPGVPPRGIGQTASAGLRRQGRWRPPTVLPSSVLDDVNFLHRTSCGGANRGDVYDQRACSYGSMPWAPGERRQTSRAQGHNATQFTANGSNSRRATAVPSTPNYMPVTVGNLPLSPVYWSASTCGRS